MKKFFVYFFIAVPILCGAIPQQINYQGHLTRPDGTALDSTLSITFAIYDAEFGGAVLWAENHPSVNVEDGLFHVLLGSDTPLTDLFSADRWLGIAVGGDAEMTPRQQIVSVAHAYRVGTVDGASGGTISGKLNVGENNSNPGSFANVSGQNSSAVGDYSVVGGGLSNWASGSHSTISGGNANLASGAGSTISGGLNNNATNAYGAVAGGMYNFVHGQYSVIAGGGGAALSDSNSATGDYSSIGGGRSNRANGTSSVVCGGKMNRANNNYDAVVGGDRNYAGGSYAFVGGGLQDTARNITDAVCGGWINTASGGSSFVGGGKQNTATAAYAAVGGGTLNDATGSSTTVGGGYNNLASGAYATVCGGRLNHARGTYSVIAGGGGAFFADSNHAGGDASAVCGGRRNTASGNQSFVGGGSWNTASGIAAMVPGGSLCNAEGDHSFAAGDSATTTGDHSFVLGAKIVCAAESAFVWSDGSGPVMSIGSSRTFSVKATAGTRIWTNNGLTAGVTIGAGGNAWVAVSDSTKKRDIRLLDTQDILDRFSSLPLKRWEYKSEDQGIEHIGPMAQDFWNSFHLGSDSLGIATIDADGVMMAVVQELAKQNGELLNQLTALRAHVQMLEAAQQQGINKEK